jgi:hypothetical protein
MDMSGEHNPENLALIMITFTASLCSLLVSNYFIRMISGNNSRMMTPEEVLHLSKPVYIQYQ